MNSSLAAPGSADANLVNIPRMLELDVNRMMYGHNQVQSLSRIVYLYPPNHLISSNMLVQCEAYRALPAIYMLYRPEVKQQTV